MTVDVFYLASFIASIPKLRATSETMTHLRLQKLTFYAFAALVALDGVSPSGVVWEAWSHGPVNHPLFNRLESFGTLETVGPRDLQVSPYLLSKTRHQEIVGEVIDVYGLLDTWELRNQVCDEWIWKQTQRHDTIAPQQLRRWANETFVTQVRLPSRLLGAAWPDLEGVQPATYESFNALAGECRAIGLSQSISEGESPAKQ